MKIHTKIEMNCTKVIDIIDVDKNGVINAYELQTAVAITNNVSVNQHRYFQTNCSLCANAVKDYYVYINQQINI